MQMERFTIKAQEAIAEAQRIARDRGHAELDVLHLVMAMVGQDEGVVPPLLNRLGVQRDSFVGQLEQLASKRSQVSGASVQIQPAKELLALFDAAATTAGDMKDEYISTEHLFLAAVSRCRGELGSLFKNAGVTEDGVLKALQSVRGSQRVTDNNPEDKYEVIKKYGQDLTERARKGQLDPVIGRDGEIRRVIQVLSRRTKNNPVLIGEPGVGKTAIAEGLAQRIVAGDVPGGLKNKKVISLDLASMVAGAKFRGEFEERFKAFMKEVVEAAGEIVLFIDELHTLVGAGAAEGSMDASNMIKPALARGELRCIGATTLDEFRKYIEKDAALERRFQTVMVEEPSVADTIAILRGLRERYEVHHGVRIQDAALVAAGTLADRYISDRFLPDKAIDLVDEAASRLRVEIDSMPTEIDEVERRIMQLEIEREALRKEKDAVSKERLHKIEEELSCLREDSAVKKLHWEKEKELIDSIRSLTEALDVMRGRAESAQRDNDLEKAAEILYDLIPKTEKQIEAAQSALAEQQKETKMLKEEVDAEDIAGVVAFWTHIPVSRLLEGEKKKLLQMESRIQERVIGQSEAVAAVSNAVRRSRSGLQDPDRPVGSFLFMGPTGVGKTELARALAGFLFDNEHAMIRVDMSEFMEKHSVARLIGAPPGYVGYDEGGYLTEHVRRHPYSVILFDEVEKAHSDVFNVMLQILDDGRLTDGKGRTVDFTHTIIILTSNIGSQIIHETLAGQAKINPDEPAYHHMEEQVQAELAARFRPEFLNRLDDTIIFHSLTRDQIGEIVGIQLQRLQKHLDERSIILKLSDKAKAKLVDEGYDPAYGARPLKRVIQRRILDGLSEAMLADKIIDGQVVEIGIDQDENFVFD